MNRFPNCYGKDRLSCPISIVQGVKSSEIVKKTTLGELLKDIQSVTPLSLELNAKLQDWYKSSPTQYKEEKEQLSAFIVGDFSKREDSACLTYAPLLIFDIDKIEDTLFTAWILQEFQKCPYVFAAFTSVSGHGLRVMVWCDATAETHKEYYESICKYLSEFTGIKTDKLLRKENQADNAIERIDTGTNNVSRLWFYTPIPKDLFYLNLNSQVFKLSEKPKITVPTSLIAEKLDESDKVKQLIEITNNLRIAGGRNNFVFTLACLLNEHGINQDTIFSTCNDFQETDFTDKEIKRTVESALKHSQYDKYSAKPSPHLKTKPNTKRQNLKAESDESNANDDEIIDLKETPKLLLIEDYLNKRYDIRNNIVSNDIEISVRGNNVFESVNEDELICELMRRGLKGVEKPLLSLLKSNFPSKYHPLRAYFEDVHNKHQWDDTKPDYIGQIATYIKAKDQFFFNAQFKKMLIRVVACSIGQIPFNKQCFTLVGKQNDGKTSFIRFLCPPQLRDYIKENLDFDKDGRLALCQNLIINLDELATLSRNDINQVKTYFTVEMVKDRPPYGKKPISFKRTASFFASTNSTEFLTDETGNVRWLVFEIEGIEHDKGGKNGYAANIDIDFVWAQAYALLKSGFEFQLTADEITYSEKNNQRFKRTYAELELIQKTFTPCKKGDENAVFMTTTEIKEELELGTTNRKLSHVSVGKALRDLGFERIGEYKPAIKNTVWGFYLLKMTT